MKKLLTVILLFALSLTMLSCVKPPRFEFDGLSPETTTYYTYDSSEITELPEAETTYEVTADEPTQTTSIPEYKYSLTIPAEMKFDFLSGAGGWWTEMTLHEDGSFDGEYIDSEMGSTGEGYNSTIYTCVFNGRFKNFKKMNQYTYSMSIDYINTEHEIGYTWIEDSIQYIASEPYGLAGGTDFLLYTPETPVAKLPEEFMIWARDFTGTLDCYAIRNLANDQGFTQSYSINLECEYLADHIINHVMTSDWLNTPYTVCDDDIHRFLVSLCAYGNSPHPYAFVSTFNESNMAFLMDYSSVNTLVRTTFNRGYWATTSYAESLLDAERKFYVVPDGIGLPTSPFSYTNMTSEFDGEYIYVRFTLVNSELYPYEAVNYGEHTLIFDTNYRLIDFK